MAGFLRSFFGGDQQQQQQQQEQQHATTPTDGDTPPVAEDLRAKRLARFGAPQQESTPQQCPPPPQQAQPAASPQHVSLLQSPAVATAASQRASPPQSPQPQQRSSPQPPSPQLVAPARSPSPNEPAQAPAGAMEAWEHLYLARVLHSSVVLALPDAEQASALQLIEGLTEQGVEFITDVSFGGETRCITSQLVDSIVMNWLVGSTTSDTYKGDPLAYLAHCFAQTVFERDLPRSVTKVPQSRHAHYAEVNTMCKNLLASYVAITITQPGTFSQGDAVPYILTWLKAPEHSRQYDVGVELTASLCAKYGSSGDLSQIFRPILRELHNEMAHTSISGSFMPLIQALRTLVSQQCLVLVATSLDEWLPKDATGVQLETRSFLGPFFAVSSFNNGQVAKEYFPNPTEQRNIRDVMSTIRACSTTIQQELTEVMLSVLKEQSGEGRAAGVRWFARVLEANASRTRLQVDRETTSSDGFLLNVGAVLLGLCQPFLEKQPNIDPLFLICSDLMDLSRETMLAASATDIASWVDPRNLDRQQRFEQADKERPHIEVAHDDQEQPFPPRGSKKFNFTTECFFLTLRWFHVGALPAIADNNRLWEAAQNHRSLRDSLQESRNLWQMTPEAPLKEAELHKETDLVDAALRAVFTRVAELTHPTFITRAGLFFDLLARWLLHIVSPSGPVVPLPSRVPRIFAALPEFAVETLLRFLNFANREASLVETAVPMHHVMDFLVCFLGDVAYIRNPYLRSKLVQLVRLLIPENDRSSTMSQQQLLSLFTSHEIAKAHLVSALMNFYVDIEYTGTHTQFYDKFNWRYDVQKIIMFLWTMPRYRQCVAQAFNHKEVFNKFAQYLVNDTNYLLDESLGQLSKIATIQLLQADRDAWLRLDRQTREEKEQLLRQSEGQVQHFFTLGQSTIDFLHLLSRELVGPFVQPVVVDSLASMLNYFVEMLAGPKSAELKVHNPEKYKFNPKQLLGQLADLYVALASSDSFVGAVVKDSRSYSNATFVKAVDLLQALRIRHNDFVSEFRRFVEKAHERFLAEQGTEIDEYPDEFTGVRVPLCDEPSQRFDVERRYPFFRPAAADADARPSDAAGEPHSC
eukprot:TRINITY_DN975_c0_g1_i1.p1 TRINITY_DN975_c0_g1~~TRINITY_DN975_c0_g1_i1.p1  ORF type:complete len:1093 (-),score=286.71 TRINITY_DN975_c0_g1_i1:1415-4693(-)